MRWKSIKNGIKTQSHMVERPEYEKRSYVLTQEIQSSTYARDVCSQKGRIFSDDNRRI